MTLFAAIMLGLYRRERTGLGSKVSTSLMAAGAWANSVDIQAKLCGARFPQRKPGERPINPLIAAYPSSDGHAMIIVLLDPEREFSRLCRALGEPELATNPLFADAEARKENAAELYAVLQSQFETRPLSEWRREISHARYQMVAAADARRSGARSADARLRCDRNFDYPGTALRNGDSPIFVAKSAKRLRKRRPTTERIRGRF